MTPAYLLDTVIGSELPTLHSAAELAAFEHTPYTRRIGVQNHQEHQSLRSVSRSGLLAGGSSDWQVAKMQRLPQDLLPVPSSESMAPPVCRGRTCLAYRDFSALCSALAAPIAVFTCFSSSGGGSTAFIPRDSIQSSRHHPLE